MAGADTRTLLLVEDDQALLAMLERLLSDEGYAVTVASDGQRGLHLGLTRPFDVMVIDRGLPAIEGVDLLGRLRSRSVGSPA
ncbi:MAG TPA: response regulator, partial [Mycobacteriales bacterium]